MKAILLIETDNCWDCPLERDEKCQYAHRKIAKNNIPSWCPLKHPLKYASNDFYIYDTKYLMENLDREINLLKGTKAYKEIMEKRNESNSSAR